MSGAEPPVGTIRPLAILGLAVAGVIVLVAIGAVVVVASMKLGPTVLGAIRAAASSDYKVVDASSPVYSSSRLAFAIKFPSKPVVHKFSDGDLDVYFRNGVSDYSIVAATLNLSVPPADEHAVYLNVLDGIKVKGVTRTSFSTSVIDGIQSERATFHRTTGTNPWNYSVVVCGKHLYQLNTYGLKAADTRKFEESLILKDKTTDACH